MARRPARNPSFVPDGGARGGGVRGGFARGRARRAGPPGRWRLILWRLRFVVSAGLLGVAAALVVAEVRPPPTPTVPVVVAARDLAPGAALTAADVRIARMPTALVPGGAHPEASDVVGQSLVAAAPDGLAIVDGLLAGDRLAAAGPPGTVVAPVRLADPAVAALLRPGDRIDLLGGAPAADGEPVARTLARHALVLADPGPANGADEPTAGGLLGAGTDQGAGTLTLVAVRPAEAAALAGSVGWSPLSAVVVE